MGTAREVFEEPAAEHLDRHASDRGMVFGRDRLTVGGREGGAGTAAP